MKNMIALIFCIAGVALLIFVGYEFITHMNYEQKDCLITMGDKCSDTIPTRLHTQPGM